MLLLFCFRFLSLGGAAASRACQANLSLMSDFLRCRVCGRRLARLGCIARIFLGPGSLAWARCTHQNARKRRGKGGRCLDGWKRNLATTVAASEAKDAPRLVQRHRLLDAADDWVQGAHVVQ